MDRYAAITKALEDDALIDFLLIGSARKGKTGCYFAMMNDGVVTNFKWGDSNDHPELIAALKTFDFYETYDPKNSFIVMASDAADADAYLFTSRDALEKWTLKAIRSKSVTSIAKSEPTVMRMITEKDGFSRELLLDTQSKFLSNNNISVSDFFLSHEMIEDAPDATKPRLTSIRRRMDAALNDGTPKPDLQAFIAPFMVEAVQAFGSWEAYEDCSRRYIATKRNMMDEFFDMSTKLDESMKKIQRRAVCALCGAKGNFQTCAQCHDVSYCCKKHQVSDWKRHKIQCKETAKARSKQ